MVLSRRRENEMVPQYSLTGDFPFSDVGCSTGITMEALSRHLDPSSCGLVNLFMGC